MKQLIAFFFSLCFIFSLGHAQVVLNNNTDSTSYAIGFDLGRNIKKGGVELNVEILQRGIAAAMETGETDLLGEEVIQALIQAWSMEAQKRFSERMQQIATENKTKGDSFLAENAKLEGITVTESGLQYKVLQAGEGERPTDTSTVTVHYEGKLLDGTIFDSSYERGEPIEFTTGQVIPGWTEALKLMPAGSKWQVFIPSDLGYGERGTPDGSIPPNSVLIFDVELISIQ